MTKSILVVGASIAGPAVCYWLKKYGFEPTLIERNDGLRKGGYAIDVRGIAVDVAKQMGIYDELCRQRTTLEYGAYVDENGKVLYKEEGEKFGFRQNEEVEVVRGDFVDILMKTIPEVPCHFSQSIAGIEQHEDNATVHFKDGSSKQYDLVIAADGLHSSTRRDVFANEFTLNDLGCYISVFSIPNYLKLDHSERLYEKGQKLVYVNSDKDTSMAHAGFMFRSNHQLNNIRDEKEQRVFLTDTFSDFGWESNKLLELLKDSDDLYFDSITQVKMASWTKGRVALLGDAGYCASPLSGQGSSLALVGAYILAGELHLAKNDHQQAFEHYNELMRPFVDANQTFGVLSSQTFLSEEKVSKEVAEERTNKLIEKLQEAATAIELPSYPS